MNFANSICKIAITIIATGMRYIYCCLLLTILALPIYGQSVVRTPCSNFAISEGDSVCLDVLVNIAPEEVERIIRNEQKDVLLIFDGWSNWAKRLLNGTNLKNEQIAGYLKKYKIITLYVDDRTLVNEKDSTTIGKRNMLYQMDRFQAVTQPYYLVIKGGKAKCSAGYMPDHANILAFLKRCK